METSMDDKSIPWPVNAENWEIFYDKVFAQQDFPKNLSENDKNIVINNMSDFDSSALEAIDKRDWDIIDNKIPDEKDVNMEDLDSDGEQVEMVSRYPPS